MREPLFWIVYDSVTNSVFAGQVLVPLVRRLQMDPELTAILVSFEPTAVPQKLIDEIGLAHERLVLIVMPRSRFLGLRSLRPSIKKLQTFLPGRGSYTLVARGPLAGFIALHAIDRHCCRSLTIQARGLLAEEYRYDHKKTWWLWPAHALRAWQYERLEKKVYAYRKNVHIEVVTEALADYLVQKFGAQRVACTLAADDIPKKISRAKIIAWRCAARSELGINLDAVVYCFSGAVKAWQKPELVINFFKKQCLSAQDDNAVLLVLSPDAATFEKVLQAHLPRSSYRVLSVSHDSVFYYLAAGDIGVVLRDKGALSWISRPVKAMEYKAVGLPILHNNTVQWLVKRHGICDCGGLE